MHNKKEGFPFLKGVDDHTLQTWVTFMETPLYAFIVKHFTNEINSIGAAVLSNEKYVEHPVSLAKAQGKVSGMKRVFSEFFNDIRTEYNGRLDRSANAGADKHR